MVRALVALLVFSAPAFSADARITGPRKKLEAQLKNLADVSAKCRPNSQDISDVSGSITAGNVTNAIAIAGGGTAMVTSGISVVKEIGVKRAQKDSTKTEADKLEAMEKATETQGKLRLASAIGSGVATAGNTVSTIALSGAGKKLDGAVDYYAKCFEALEAVNTSGW
jgi:hypothetical protein